MKSNLKIILFYLVLIAVIIFFVAQVFTTTQADKLVYSDIVTYFEQEQVSAFVVDEDYLLTMTLKDGTEVSYQLKSLTIFRDDLGDLILEQKSAGIIASYDYEPETVFPWWVSMLPYLIIIVIFVALWFYVMNQAMGGKGNKMNSFGKARVKTAQPDQKNRVLFRDVAGADEEKAELAEVVDFLRAPQKYTQIGARIPHGLLLVGPPGTGKTLLARAVAGEANVAFLSISGSDFMEMYVGVGASRVRDLFQQAKKMAPAIIFIDEIDAVGRKRGTGLGGGHDEREQTLNQLLVEMDGFGRTEGVIVLAATNRADILDPALLRPGRFDRQIYVGRPDVKGRTDILKVHAKDKRLDEKVDLKTVARATPGFTGADLSNLLNEAAILAARENREALSMADINEAMMKITAGPAKRSHVKQRKDLRATAIHEAGHAVAMHLLPSSGEVQHITIIPRGQSLGATWHMPKEDSTHLTRNQMYEEIVGLLGGRVAEDLFLGDISTGASSDIDRATKLAKDMVARYGMCEKLGTVSYLGGGEVFIGRDYQTTKSYSEKVAGTIDEEVKNLIDRAYAHCKELLSSDSEKLNQVAEYLLANESMTGDQFAACMEGREIHEASATSLFDNFRSEEKAEPVEEQTEE